MTRRYTAPGASAPDADQLGTQQRRRFNPRSRFRRKRTLEERQQQLLATGVGLVALVVAGHQLLLGG